MQLSYHPFHKLGLKLVNLSESGNIPKDEELFIRYEISDAKILLHFFIKNITKVSITYFILLKSFIVIDNRQK